MPSLIEVVAETTEIAPRCIRTLLYASGIRVSELCGLCWRDVQPNCDGGQITIFWKGCVTRSVQRPSYVW